MMIAVEKQLAALGFGGARREPACWRAVRLDPPASVTSTAERPDASCSAALLRWRDLLRRSPRQSPYRISRATK
jgi:hypothetical protein